MKRSTTKRSGFSLLEVLLVVAILSIVMAVVFSQIGNVQKRARSEDMKLDLTQETREYADMIARDLHNVGYPSQKMFNTSALLATPANDNKVAVGLVKVAYDELWFEGDVDGDGQVDVIDYKLQADPNTNNCPCRISRSQVIKATNTAPMSQTNNTYNVELTDVINSGGASGAATGVAKWTITGSNLGSTNDTYFSSYKNANVFTYFDANGNEVTPTDISTTAGQTAIKTIKTIRININVLARQVDLRTGVRPVMSFSEAVRVSSF